MALKCLCRMPIAGLSPAAWGVSKMNALKTIVEVSDIRKPHFLLGYLGSCLN